MKKFSRTLLICLVSAIFALSLTACGGDKKDTEESTTAAALRGGKIEDLYGTWKGTQGGTFTFSEDGTCLDQYDSIKIEGTYSVDEILGTISVTDSETGMTFTYSYVIDGNSLTIQMGGGLPRKFTK